MRIETEFSQDTLTFTFTPHGADSEAGQNPGQGTGFSPTQEGRMKLARNQCRFVMPKGWALESVHPDALALSAVLLAYAFSGKRLDLSFAVSSQFAASLRSATGIGVSPIDTSIKPRKCVETASLALSYSGGVDSTAALLVMPKETKLFFVDRIFPAGEERPTKYNKEHALFACKYLSELGRDVYMVQSDFEYIRDPVGVGVDLGFGIPALLLCDFANLGGLAYGMIAESAYRTGHAHFEDYVERSHYERWWSLFEAIDIPLTLPTAGMSEVATSKIVADSCHRGLAQSCVRGGVHSPCMRCWKCIRKSLLDMAIAEDDLDSETLWEMFSTPDAKRYLGVPAIKHENVITWITSRYRGDNELMLALKTKARGDTLRVSWMEKWFPDAGELLPARYRQQIKEGIAQRIEVMGPEDCQDMKGWNLGVTLHTDEAREAHKAVVTLFESLNPLKKKLQSQNPKAEKTSEDTDEQSYPKIKKEVELLTVENRMLQKRLDTMRSSTRWRVATFVKKALAGKHPFSPRQR
ncbi:MAG: hypothetical protein GY811_15695 [Myxococcales bacterium]|nr:hypothetical protein [Myxococcales bacterium]